MQIHQLKYTLGAFVVADELDGKCTSAVLRISSVLLHGIIFRSSTGHCMCKFVENHFNLKALGVNLSRSKTIVLFCQNNGCCGCRAEECVKALQYSFA